MHSDTANADLLLSLSYDGQVLQVGVTELKGLLFSGNFTQPAFTTAMHSIKRLEEMRLL